MLTDLETAIRELIQASEFLQRTLRDSGKINTIWSALDIVDDTEVGIGEYHHFAVDQNADGSYLIIFGILQLLQVQQDAVFCLCKALGVLPSDPELKDIREIRHNAVGHPVVRERGPKTILGASNLINRGLLSRSGFVLHTHLPDGAGFAQQTVNIPKLIDIQRTKLAVWMQQALSVLQQMENQHREQFREVKFVAIFQGIDYVAQKLLEATISEHLFCLGESHINMLVDAIGSYEGEVCRRGLSKSYLLEFPPLKRALTQLEGYFSGRSDFTHDDGYIYADYVRRQIGQLIRTGSDIDEHYQSEV